MPRKQSSATGKKPNRDATSAPLPVIDPAAFSEQLVSWYRERARDLPWRRTSDAYPIWVSEIMLQQTRVETVIPYFERFLDQFPTLRALAEADVEEVVAHWSGLGYYSRARNLHKGAGFVMEKHGGSFPEAREEALQVPGIGPYTSAAILSIAYGKAHAVVDGNVIRVLSRLYRLQPPQDRRVPFLEDLAGNLMNRAAPADFNQAMMELGATVCRPRQPECGKCPVREHCSAHARHDVENFPAPKKKPDLEYLDFTLFLVQDERGRWLLEKGEWPYIPHLWLPPIVAGGSAEEPVSAAWARWVRARKFAALEPGEWQERRPIKHSVTFRRMTFRIFETTCNGHGVTEPEGASVPRDEPGQVWVPAGQIGTIGHSSILKKALGRREDQLSLGLS